MSFGLFRDGRKRGSSTVHEPTPLNFRFNGSSFGVMVQYGQVDGKMDGMLDGTHKGRADRGTTRRSAYMDLSSS
jgi:hypothetical protein